MLQIRERRGLSYERGKGYVTGSILTNTTNEVSL